jgi:hypothetical protein
MFENMVRAMELHGTLPPIDEETFEFEKLGEALASLPDGKHFGKIVCQL